MSKTTLYLAVGVAGVIVLIVIISSILFAFQGKKPAYGPVGGTFPTASSTVTNIIPVQTQTTVITEQNGSQVTAKDFIHNGVTIEDPANPGTYYLAGSSGYCYANGDCPKAGSSDEFIITYNPSSSAFNIALIREPLGQGRRDAEQYLSNALGLTQQQMCNLHYFLSTTSYVNSTYGGDQLGFSFCPGAVPLP